ncbi:MAG: phenylalanine--tRNA ligase subunit alpha [Pirellulales bacterium]|nr:phenylalanine--tRNA ligase subunit alpha [Pirellulales bacterium]
MALSDYLTELDSLLAEATAAFDAADDETSLEAARVRFVGAKSGRLKAVQKGLGAVEKADRPAAGKRFNEVKQAIASAHQAAVDRLAAKARPAALARCADPTVPGVCRRLGRLHPITQTIEELKEIMGRLGFSVVDGPEVEDQWHNFEALNIPDDHPARNPLENFYIESHNTTPSFTVGAAVKLSPQHTARSPALNPQPPLLLRSQTSTVQIRAMERMRPPVRVISCGRVYRPDTADATHFPMFHQMEGLLVDRGVTMADLKSTLRLFARSAFADDVHIRFRPSFFPFTEPSVEVDMSWADGWIEMGGAGMVDPHVLQAVGYDTEEYTGFAFGLGIERICARRHGIADIRELFKNDVRFLAQF